MNYGFGTYENLMFKAETFILPTIWVFFDNGLGGRNFNSLTISAEDDKKVKIHI